MKRFTENTRLWEIVHCPQFRTFRKYLIAPRGFRQVMQVYRLRDMKRFYPFDPSSSAETLNNMRKMVDDGTLTYTPFARKDTGLFAFLIGQNRPFVLILPGGGYGDVCSIIEGYTTALEFNRRGYNAFIDNYGVGKQARYPGPQDDVARMLKRIFTHKAEWNVSVDNYAVCGFSAGGNLAGSWGMKEVGYARCGLPKPGALMLCYPVTSLLDEHTHGQSQKRLLGKDRGDRALQRRYSIECNVDGDYPATFLWQCSDDPLKNSALLADSLKRADVRYEYIVYEGGAHGVGAGTGTAAEGWIDKAVCFWEESL